MFIYNDINFSTAVYLVRGVDAHTYLQGQFSQDLKNPIGSADYGLWLNEKGRVLADSFVLRIAQDAFLVINWHSGDTAEFGTFIQRNLIADEVEVIEESEKWVGLQILGEGSSRLIANVCKAAPEPGKYLEHEGVLAFAGVPAAENFFLLVPAESALAWRGKLNSAGATAVDPATLRREQMLAGLISIPGELGPGDLPHEGGLGDSAVSYTKGCYLGQEVTNRLKSMGQVRRRLHVVRGAGRTPIAPADLFQAGKRLGELRTVVPEGDGFVGVAMLKLRPLDLAQGLSLSAYGASTVRVLKMV